MSRFHSQGKALLAARNHFSSRVRGSTISAIVIIMKRRANIHPGEILEQEFMTPVGMTVESLACSLGVSIDKVKGLLAGNEPITAEIAVGLGRTFKTTNDFWINLQSEYDKIQLTIEAQKLGLGY